MSLKISLYADSQIIYLESASDGTDRKGPERNAFYFNRSSMACGFPAEQFAAKSKTVKKKKSN